MRPLVERHRPTDRNMTVDGGVSGHPSVGALPREVADGVHWLSTCLVLGETETALHTHNSAFLVVGDRRALLVDTGMPSGWASLGTQLERALAGRELTDILPTHPEIPHMGNLGQLADRFPQARIIGDLRNFHLFHPELLARCHHLDEVATIDLGERMVRVTPAPIHDLPNSRWAWDESTRTLFTSDAFAYSHPHLSGECAALSHELRGRPTIEDAAFVIRQALHWPRYVAPDLALAELRRYLADREPRMIAPAHGGVITEPRRLMEIYTQALAEIHAQGRADADAG